MEFCASINIKIRAPLRVHKIEVTFDRAGMTTMRPKFTWSKRTGVLSLKHGVSYKKSEVAGTGVHMNSAYR